MDYLINHKGAPCPYKPITCQEGFCDECWIYRQEKGKYGSEHYGVATDGYKNGEAFTWIR